MSVALSEDELVEGRHLTHPVVGLQRNQGRRPSASAATWCRDSQHPDALGVRSPGPHRGTPQSIKEALGDLADVPEVRGSA